MANPRVAKLAEQIKFIVAEMLERRQLLDGLTGQYFNRVDRTELVTTRTDPTPVPVG